MPSRRKLKGCMGGGEKEAFWGGFRRGQVGGVLVEREGVRTVGAWLHQIQGLHDGISL